MPKFDPKKTIRFKANSHPTLLASLLSPYQTIIEIGEDHEIFVDRFSLGVLKYLTILSLPKERRIFTCGAFCEIADDVKLIVGGNHSNSEIINISFGSIGVAFQAIMDIDEIKFFFPFARSLNIEHNVVLSKGSIVLDGSHIGHGTVVGAGCVVRGNLDPYGVYVGSPSRKLKSRFDQRQIIDYEALRLSDIRPHCLPLLKHTTAVNRDTVVLSQIEYMSSKPCIKYSGFIDANGKVGIRKRKGFYIGNRSIDDKSDLEYLSKYFDQGQNGEEYIDWSPDIFYKIGYGE